MVEPGRGLHGVLVCCWALGCTQGPSEDFNRQQLLQDVSTQVVLPSFVAASAKAAALHTSVETLCAAPTEQGLSEAQDAWRAAHVAWKQTAAFQFGPVETLSANATVDWWPTDPTALDALAQASTPVTTTWMAEQGSNKRGLPALEYLLWGLGQTQADRVGALQTSPRRCQMVVALAQLTADMVTAVKDAWQSSYQQEFTSAGKGSATYPTLKAAVDQLVNMHIAAVESVVGNRMAEPLGLRGGSGTANPDLVECPFSSSSLAAMLGILDGFEASYTGVYGGSAGTSVSSYVASKNAQTDANVKTALREARAALQGFSADWKDVIQSQRDAAEQAYVKVRALKTVLGTEVVAALGVTLTFNDNDGD